MNFKLDENLGSFMAEFLVASGHNCHTVPDEGLSGARDVDVFSAAVREDRILVTLDRDFGDVLRFPPEGTAGTAVLAPHGRLSKVVLTHLAQGLLRMLDVHPIKGQLWILEPGRVRMHGSSVEWDDQSGKT